MKNDELIYLKKKSVGLGILIILLGIIISYSGIRWNDSLGNTEDNLCKRNYFTNLTYDHGILVCSSPFINQSLIFFYILSGFMIVLGMILFVYGGVIFFK